MNRREIAAIRNTTIRQRRAEGVLIKNLAADFGMSRGSISEICSERGRDGVGGGRLAPDERIPLDNITRAEIAAAVRDRAHSRPYKSARSWPI